MYQIPEYINHDSALLALTVSQFRAYNDGFQPWYTDRKKFSLHSYGSRSSVASEEGLACLNTMINANTKYLWGSALAYCKWHCENTSSSF